jgi:hypothetical protein
MAHVYINPAKGNDERSLPTLWVTTLTHEEALAQWDDPTEAEPGVDLAGWYFCLCLPGCMPDSYFYGPCETEEKGVKEGRKFFADDDC